MIVDRQIDPVARSEACLRRLAVLCDRDPAYLPLFDYWASETNRITAKADAETKSRARAADLAWKARLNADAEFAGMFA